MLDKLKEEINNLYGAFLMDHEIMWILDFLEKQGMLPPSVPTGASGWEIRRGKPAFINEWEPEDE